MGQRWDNRSPYHLSTLGLSTSLWPGALPLLRNLTNLMRVWASASATSSCSFPTSKWQSSGFLRRIKIFIVILDQFVDFIKVIRITMIAFYAEMSLDRFGKQLRFISVSLGDFVRVVQGWIVALTPRLKEILDFAPRLVGDGL